MSDSTNSKLTHKDSCRNMNVNNRNDHPPIEQEDNLFASLCLNNAHSSIIDTPERNYYPLCDSVSYAAFILDVFKIVDNNKT